MCLHPSIFSGWGVGADGTSIFFNSAVGSSLSSEYSLVGFSATTTTAITTVASSNGKLRVTHDFHPTPKTPNLYEVTVTLENTSPAKIFDLRYRRTM
mmetsp:Transcript_9553/g.20658  ORF Transcript_9553/g.20658 Transcript_9553/m.20658 type:complete len:97 (-) Transcript_9553:273-563(-)